jgi:hypothetical protein
MNGSFYLSAATDGFNHQLYKYSLASKTTSLVATINPTGPAEPYGYTLYNGKLLLRSRGHIRQY